MRFKLARFLIDFTNTGVRQKVITPNNQNSIVPVNEPNLLTNGENTFLRMSNNPNFLIFFYIPVKDRTINFLNVKRIFLLPELVAVIVAKLEPYNKTGRKKTQCGKNRLQDFVSINPQVHTFKFKKASGFQKENLVIYLSTKSLSFLSLPRIVVVSSVSCPPFTFFLFFLVYPMRGSLKVQINQGGETDA